MLFADIVTVVLAVANTFQHKLLASDSDSDALSES